MGIRIWRVEAERSVAATFYVLAPSKDAAVDDAQKLSPDVLADSGPEDDDVYVVEVELSKALIDQHGVWTGGPDGDWYETREAFDDWMREQEALELVPKPIRGQLDVFGGEVRS